MFPILRNNKRMPLSPQEFVGIIEGISAKLSQLTEEEEMNILINVVKNAVERRGTYPLFVIDAIIDVLDARSLMIGLSPGSKRLDN